MITLHTKVLKKHFFFYTILMLFALIQTSCQQESKKSILILAFEQLSPDQLNCSEERSYENSGFAIVCRESTRFSKAYTTSLQPAAAIGSILTGQYPLTHELHRSFDRISSNQKSLAQVALSNGYRTAFFSGSPNVLKRTGLAKFFETFDDSVGAQYSQQIIKDFKTSTQDFLNWLNEDSSGAFLTIITNAEIGAFNEKDTRISNFEKLDEKLFQFIQQLKADNIWQKSYIIVVGLKGQDSYNRVEETSYTNLHSENTKISLFIKPPRMKGDEGISWKTDDVVNLADLGYSLKRIFNHEEQNQLEPFQNVNLFEYLKQGYRRNNDNRSILIEAPDLWLGQTQYIRLALTNSKTLAITQSNEIVFFNTLTDTFETLPLNKNELFEFEDIQKTIMTIKQNKNLNFNLNRPQIVNQVLDKEDLRNYKLTNLESKKINDKFQACIKLIDDKKINIEKFKKCRDPLFLEFLKYKHHNFFGVNEDKAKLAYEVAKKNYFENLKIQKLNFQLENIWGLYNANKNYFHALMKYDPSFFN